MKDGNGGTGEKKEDIRGEKSNFETSWTRKVKNVSGPGNFADVMGLY